MSNGQKIIDGWEIKDSGMLKVHYYTNGHRQEHEWWNVHRSVIMKVLNAKSPPAVSDIEGWIRDYDDAQKKKEKQNSIADCCSYGWYSEDNR